MERTQALARQYDKLFIGGEWIDPSTDNMIEIFSPHDQSLAGYTVAAGKPDVDKAVAAAKNAFEYGPWPTMSPEERQRVIETFNELHQQYVSDFASLTTTENGSPIWFTTVLQEMVKEQTAAYLRAAKGYPWEEKSTSENGAGVLIRREPVGVAAIVVPWNAPQQSALVKIIPALLAGCTVVFKPSPETALDGIALGEIFAAAGLPKGALNIVPGGRDEGAYLISHPGIDKIAFTGSTRAGKLIATAAGENLKRLSLELGGKSAAIILEDADLKATVNALKYSCFSNNGESCVAQTRILAPVNRYEEIVEALSNMANNTVVGDPSNLETFVGPLVSETQYNRVLNYIRIGLDEGATVAAGGLERPVGKGLEKGFYVKPTVLRNVNNQMRVAREEIFGPVIVVIPYESINQAIAIANDSDYGLSGSVWTSNKEVGIAIAKLIRTGTFTVNTGRGGGGGFDYPFGGYKSSGIGREFGKAGIDGYVELKTINIG